MSILSYVVDHGSDIVSASVALITGIIAVAAIIPGDHPDKELQAIVDFIKKFSRK